MAASNIHLDRSYGPMACEWQTHWGKGATRGAISSHFSHYVTITFYTSGNTPYEAVMSADADSEKLHTYCGRVYRISQ